MSLPEKIFALSSFKRQYEVIISDFCTKSFAALQPVVTAGEVDWNNMLSCASILSLSEEFQHQEAALRIAQACLETNSNESQKLAGAVLLDNLTNRPAIKLAVKRNYLKKDYEDQIPLPLVLDISKRKISHTIINGDREIYLNRFQRQAYLEFITSDVVSVSAPTSAGKSFILYQTLIQFIIEATSPINIVYIVPTRALISQVERDFMLTAKEYKINDVFISSVPRLDNSELKKSQVFVFTQERLHYFRTQSPDFKFNYVIVDEAQKISEGNRGILLQQKIEELVRDMPDIKIFYSSALTSNPEILYSDLESKQNKTSVKTEFVAVNQNLLYVTQQPGHTMKWNTVLCTRDKQIPLGSFNLKYRPTGDLKKIAFIVEALSHQDGGSIVYMNKAAFAERLANILYDALPDVDANQEIRNLIDFTKDTVHKDYLLNKVLTKRIAFHYGNMPILIRQEIERLFEAGLIKYLICTSTLLEGINLPAKSIFLKAPTRGTGNPLKDADFWNLAGRAGRLGKEFQGNIICIEPQTWVEKPTLENRKQEIVKSIDKVTANYQDLLAYVRDKTPRGTANDKPELEYALTYFYSAYLDNKLPQILELKNKEFFTALMAEFEAISKDSALPKEIILRNPGISPIAQQNLYDYFKTKEGTIENYIPDLPEATDAVNNSYLRVVGIINKYFIGGPDRLSYYYAILVVNWMRGLPLSVIIKNSVKYFETHERNKKLDAIIRDSMKDVEEFARFKFAKYSSCYVDILRYYLNNSNKQELSQRIPDLHIWLEFGVSQETQVSLITLGLTRQTAISLSEFIANDHLTKEECLDWIYKNDLTTLQLSPLVIDEIRTKLIPESSPS